MSIKRSVVQVEAVELEFVGVGETRRQILLLFVVAKLELTAFEGVVGLRFLCLDDQGVKWLLRMVLVLQDGHEWLVRVIDVRDKFVLRLLKIFVESLLITAHVPLHHRLLLCRASFRYQIDFLVDSLKQIIASRFQEILVVS